MILRVRKRPGKEKEDVLKAAGDSDEPGAPPEEEEEAYHYGYDVRVLACARRRPFHASA